MAGGLKVILGKVLVIPSVGFSSVTEADGDNISVVDAESGTCTSDDGTECRSKSR